MDIKQILAKNDFTFAKKFGQNFITDTNLLSAIAADASIAADDTVVEVGAGAGTLTRAISLAAGKVVSFEIDKRLEPILAETLKGCSNVELVFTDILKTKKEDIKDFCGNCNYKVVANLPYYITTPIIFYFLDDENCTSITIMVQKEVAQRLTAKPGKAEYGSITAQVAAFGSATITRTVSRNLFVPVPNVDSAIVRIDKKKNENIKNPELLRRVIAAAFDMRRKTLANNLIKNFSLSKEVAESVLSNAGIEIGIRGERLDLDAFIRLCDCLKQML